jgi:hypothetical protein
MGQRGGLPDPRSRRSRERAATVVATRSFDARPASEPGRGRRGRVARLLAAVTDRRI